MAPAPVSLADYEALARAKMDRGAFDYIAGGSGDERTLAMNVQAFDRYVLRPRVLVDARTVDTSTTVLGQPLAAPIMLAPTAFHRLAHPEGERATARAALALGTVFVLSTVASTSIEEVAAAIGRPYLWGLAVDGEQGVRNVYELLRSELELAMALSGRTSIGAIDRSLVSEA